MKSIFSIIIILFSISNAQAQTGSWKIKLNGKILLSTNKEDEKLNCKKIKPAQWNENGYLEISFTEDEPDTWWRSFHFNDEQDNELIRKDSVTYFKIPAKELQRIFTGKKEIRIYTTIAPRDPNLAVRIRRVHLCTLRF
ncbi:MAG TPA: hypothetical protein PKG90_01030 [Chitinophagaceae bacterium]|nr:hypothetical protein [Chitinophagaceae bacterium]HNU13668.1 hypothetical protein [Chitinophagaceae bacterium]